MKTNFEKSKIGVEKVKNYLKEQGRIIIDKKPNGSDIVFKKNRRSKREFTIEVKTTEKFNGGVPDMHCTEFKKSAAGFHLVADFLYIVRLKKDRKNCQIDILSKKEVDKYATGSNGHKPKMSVRVSSTLKTALRDGQIGKRIELKL